MANLNVDVTDKAFGSIQRCSSAAVFSLERWVQLPPLDFGLYGNSLCLKLQQLVSPFFHLDVPIGDSASILVPEVAGTQVVALLGFCWNFLDIWTLMPLGPTSDFPTFSIRTRGELQYT